MIKKSDPAPAMSTDPNPKGANGWTQRLFAALAAKAIRAQGGTAFVKNARPARRERLAAGECPHMRTLHLKRPHPKYGDKVPYFHTVLAHGCEGGCEGFPSTSGGSGTTITEKAVRRAPRWFPSSFETHKVVVQGVTEFGCIPRASRALRVELKAEEMPVMVGDGLHL